MKYFVALIIIWVATFSGTVENPAQAGPNRIFMARGHLVLDTNGDVWQIASESSQGTGPYFWQRAAWSPRVPVPTKEIVSWGGNEILTRSGVAWQLRLDHETDIWFWHEFDDAGPWPGTQ